VVVTWWWECTSRAACTASATVARVTITNAFNVPLHCAVALGVVNLALQLLRGFRSRDYSPLHCNHIYCTRATYTSVCVVTQKLPQLVELGLQTHSPFSHVCELGQLCTLHCPSTALPHVLGTFRLRHTPLQRVNPCRHWQLQHRHQKKRIAGNKQM
jgi:hypothetical protein